MMQKSLIPRLPTTEDAIITGWAVIQELRVWRRVILVIPKADLRHELDSYERCCFFNGDDSHFEQQADI